MLQTPLEQAPVAFGGAQPVPHAKQFAADVLRFTSQPFAWLPSQSPKPALQLPSAHAPPTQLADPFAKLQAVPQVPQLATSPRRPVSQPVCASRSQSPKPALQPFSGLPGTQPIASGGQS